MKNEYGTGGKGFEIDGAKYASWFDDLGLRIAAGDTAKGGTVVNAFLSWEDVSNRIHELLRQGEYVEHLPWIEDFKSYQNLTSLNRRVLVELVESITVYDKEHIHIQYRFDQEIRNVLEYCSSVPAAETEESAV